MVQAVKVQHGDHLLFDQLLSQLEVRKGLNGGGPKYRLIDLREEETSQIVTSCISQMLNIIL